MNRQIIDIFHRIQLNLSRILNRMNIVNIIYAREEYELYNCFIEHIEDRIKTIIEEDTLLNEMLIHIDSQNNYFSKEQFKRWLKQLDIELHESEEDLNVLTINNYTLYFNSTNELTMLKNDVDEIIDTKDSLEEFEEITDKFNLFNMNLVKRTMEERDMNTEQKMRFIVYSVNQTIQFVFFELMNQFIRENNIHVFDNIQPYRMVYGLCF